MFTESQLAQRAHTRKDYQVADAVSTSAYTSGFNLGTVMKVDTTATVVGPNEEAPLSSILQSLCLFDPDGLSIAMDLFFFNQSPAGTYTDKTAFAPTAADLQNCIGVVHIAATDYIAAGGGQSIASKPNIGLVMKPSEAAKGTGIWVIAVTRGTPTPVVGKYYFRFQFSHGL